MDLKKDKIELAGVVDDVKADIDKWFKEKFKHSQGSWIEIEIKLKNID